MNNQHDALTNRNDPIFTIKLLLGFSLLMNVIVSPARAEEYQGDVKDVSVVRRVEQEPGSALLWEPSIAEWKPKHLVVVFGAGIPGKTDMGDMLSCVSTDDGKTWSEPSFVFDHRERYGAMQFGYANPELYKPPGQDVLWCFAMRCPMAYQHSEDSQMCAAYSADGGRSWLPVELAMHYSGPLILGGLIYRTEKDGHPIYLLPAHRNEKRNDPSGVRDHIVLSSTSLLDWRLAGVIPQPESGKKIFLQEGQIAEGDAPGELKIVMRSADYDNEHKAADPPTAYSSISKDGGHTWSPAASEPQLWNTNAKGFYCRSQNGSHVYIYSDGPAWSRMALRYKVQPAGGDWGKERTFFDSAAHNSYINAIEHAPGELYLVWDSGTADRPRTHIRFGKLTLAAQK